MAYVYFHRKKTDDSIFYVGVSESTIRNRCQDAGGRNNLWKKVAKKYGWYSEIYKSDITIEECFLIEIELIAKYGRIDLGTGVLANLTNGGEGTVCWAKPKPVYIYKGVELITVCDNVKLAAEYLDCSITVIETATRYGRTRVKGHIVLFDPSLLQERYNKFENSSNLRLVNNIAVVQKRVNKNYYVSVFLNEHLLIKSDNMFEIKTEVEKYVLIENYSSLRSSIYQVKPYYRNLTFQYEPK